MKRNTLLSLILAVVCAFCGLLGGCDTNENPSSETGYTLTVDDISLLVGTEYTPNFVLKAGGETVEGAVVTYRSSNSSIVSVSEGKVKAEKVGTATIAAVAKIDGQQVAESSFACKVNENKGIHPVKSSYMLYVSGNVKGISFDASSTLDAFVYENGERVENPEITWTVGDESVAIVNENGILQAVAVGETYVVGTYTNGKSVLKTIELPVKVEIPVLVTDEDVIIDKAQQVQLLDAQKILGEGEIGAIVRTLDNKTYPVSNNQVETSLFKAGEQTCVFYDAEKTFGVEVNLVAADVVIYNKDDLLLLPSYTSGYIVLANDISDVNYNRGGQPWERTFSGTFNGLGHTISNITFAGNNQSYGFFAYVNAATFKNIAIVGAKLKTAGGAFFNRSKGGETVVDNTYVEISWDKTVSKVGGICGWVWRGTLVYSNSICIVNGPMSKNGLITGKNHSQTTVKNSYVLGEGTLSGTEPGENNNYAVLNKVAGVAYATQEEFLKAINNGKTDFSGFNKYWDLSGNIPRMK